MRTEVVDVADEFAGGVDDVQSLQGAALTDELAGEIAFGILAPASAVVGDADADEMSLEQVDYFRIIEGRRTEGHDVVSAAAERLAAGNPDEDRLLGLGGRVLRFHDRHVPRDGTPQLVLGRLQLFVQFFELGRGQATG